MSQLQKIKRKNLDLEKYSRALNYSINYRIYAEHWYLDLLTDEQWECWIYGDYEVIMPVPLQFKFGIKFVLQPIYCQQLGVFYREEISDELFREFENKLHKYRVRAYHFNEENTERYQPEGEKRVNYVLDLNRPYDETFQNYSKHRRKDIRKSERLGVIIELAKNKNSFIELFKQYYSHIKRQVSESFLIKYTEVLMNKNKLVHYDVLNQERELIASQFFLDSGNRRICIGFARNKETENHNASAFVKNHLIEELSGQEFFLDFEGSMILEVAHFMEGFSPEKRHYTSYTNFSVKFSRR
ncbi:peptidoglycan bridge formation glycyltransferase FemA/FemB family protein [Moheibacter lacus]|nr:peptidoglycan bridge formation glycyltransferase FemA/FemB family protein [Moheibacter lacus]